MLILNMNYAAVIFDLDNTLVNRKLAFQSYAKLFTEKFVEIADEDSTETVNYIISADQNGYRKKRDLYEELRSKLAMKNEQTTVEDMLEYWFAEFFKSSILMQGALEVLDTIKGQNIKLGMITNGSVHSQYAKIDAVGIRDYFHTIIVSDEVGIKKPDPKIFSMALENLNISGENVLFVGDHPSNDVKGALDAGMHAVWLSGFGEWNLTGVHPTHTISQLSELNEIFR
ncbi:HAD family hydrolase [Paenibacillus eucommiae]|uniref:Hydrolase of the HAD superfamily n=1 Tax=Paenibacillus eucommiae TaxID=1355755 RepID=A0ABS4J6I1_9BACL|nr:HAD family hydrolase [Paenibacillus eucommiae]MBP1995442.1 putative hydrolase of the HAD superfamily [Paenibacillus eucommiae]